MIEIIFKPENFRIPEDAIELMDRAQKWEYENHLCYRLSEHIKNNIPFDKPIKGTYEHHEMCEKGWLKKLGDKQYIFTRKSLALLWEVFGFEKYISHG